MKPFTGILIFSAIETATVAVWGNIILTAAFKAVGLEFRPPVEAQMLAIVVLFVGYVIEHVIAFNVSKGRAALSWPRP